MSTKLECLSELEARKIGRSLMPALKQRKTAIAGLHQWKMQNRSMVRFLLYTSKLCPLIRCETSKEYGMHKGDHGPTDQGHGHKDVQEDEERGVGLR